MRVSPGGVTAQYVELETRPLAENRFEPCPTLELT
jgi:hypothetical protein